MCKRLTVDTKYLQVSMMGDPDPWEGQCHHHQSKQSNHENAEMCHKTVYSKCFYVI